MTWNQIIPEHNVLGQEHQDTELCLVLAGLWDDPEKNNFDCPWDWRQHNTQHTKDMAILGSSPTDKFAKLLDTFEAEGLGYHLTIMKTAGIMKAMNIPAQDAVEMMHQASENVSRRALQTNEIENAVEYAYNHICSGKLNVKPQPTLDLNLIERASDGGCIDQLRSESASIPQDAGSILANLYNQDDILHISKEVFDGKPKPVSSWENIDLSTLQYICPNRLKSEDQGRVLTNMAERKYAVFESDIPQLAKNWDSQAGIIEKLRSILRLVMVVYSGNKSLHAWFDCQGQSESQVHRFDNMAVKMGADRASLRPTQLVRLPWGTRDTGKVQKVIFYG